MADLTDLEATRLCAQAMNIEVFGEYGDDTGERWLDIGPDAVVKYDPLHDRAQCFELVEKFDMVIEREKDKTFGITIFAGCYKNGNPTFVIRNDQSLPHAIVHCVAKMQLSRERGGKGT